MQIKFLTDMKTKCGLCGPGQWSSPLHPVVVGAVYLGIDYARLALDQGSDPDVQTYRTAVSGVPFNDKGNTRRVNQA